MTIRTLMIGYKFVGDEPLKPRERRGAEYFNAVLSAYDLGELHHASHEGFKAKIDELDPLFVIVFNESVAREVKEYRKDLFIYVTDPPSSIFSRTAEVSAKQEKQKGIFEEIARLVQKIRDDGDEKMESTRKFAGMDFNDTYQMIIQMLTGDHEDLRAKAWELLSSKDSGSTFIWIRAKIICDVWRNADGKGMEGFLMMAMNQHVQSGLAHQLDDFTEADGRVYHQFMMHFVDGSDADYIRRIPVAEPKESRYAYENVLEMYKTPNGPQMMIESGSHKEAREAYLVKMSSNG